MTTRRPARTAAFRRRPVRAGNLLMTAVLATASLVTIAPARAAASVPADDGAKITSQAAIAPGEIDVTIQSPALGRTVKTRILLPDGWRDDAATTWPVLYAYHGGQDDYTSWTRNTDIESWARDYGAIVVMPEAADGAYTDWYNYGLGGRPRWETFHTVEVVQLMERNYRAGAVRAAIGDSAGGQGAITYAARHPGLFVHVASLSGVLSLRAPGMPEMIVLTNAVNGQDPMAIYGIPYLNDANWKKHDPIELAAGLSGTKVFFSAGTTGNPGPGDPEAPLWDIGLLSERSVGQTNVAFRAKLDQLGIPYTADIYGDGRHNWPAWIREATKIWPALMNSIGARRTR